MLIDWELVDYILLDMDGTILDKYFDDYFWEDFVPEEYAKKNKLTIYEAKKKLLERYKLEEGKLTWTDLDFWSVELGLNIPELKDRISDLIKIQPNVEEFLIFLKSKKKKLFLVTNAHYKTLEIKMKKTRLDKYFDKILSAFDVNMAKTEKNFWADTQIILGFDKERTLFIDDDEKALKAARDYGIKYLLFKSLANSKEEVRFSKEFISIIDFKEIIKNY